MNEAKPGTAELRLGLQDAAASGHWFCLGCHKISEPMDPGDVYMKCVYCKREKLEWRDPVRRHTKHPQQRAMARKNFALLAATGFYFCKECGRITALTARRRCILCAHWEVEWEGGANNLPEPVNKQVAARPTPVAALSASARFEAMKKLVEQAPEWPAGESVQCSASSLQSKAEQTENQSRQNEKTKNETTTTSEQRNEVNGSAPERDSNPNRECLWYRGDGSAAGSAG